MKAVTILGATGSIGTSALDVIARRADELRNTLRELADLPDDLFDRRFDDDVSFFLCGQGRVAENSRPAVISLPLGIPGQSAPARPRVKILDGLGHVHGFRGDDQHHRCFALVGMRAALLLEEV